MVAEPEITVQVAWEADANVQPADAEWTDITRWVRAFSVKRGRNVELDETDAGDVTLTLDNTDGRFTPGRPSSPYYPNVVPRRQVRIMAGDRVNGDVFGGVDYEARPSGSASWDGSAWQITGDTVNNGGVRAVDACDIPAYGGFVVDADFETTAGVEFQFQSWWDGAGANATVPVGAAGGRQQARWTLPLSEVPEGATGARIGFKLYGDGTLHGFTVSPLPVPVGHGLVERWPARFGVGASGLVEVKAPDRSAVLAQVEVPNSDTGGITAADPDVYFPLSGSDKGYFTDEVSGAVARNRGMNQDKPEFTDEINNGWSDQGPSLLPSGAGTSYDTGDYYIYPDGGGSQGATAGWVFALDGARARNPPDTGVERVLSTEGWTMTFNTSPRKPWNPRGAGLPLLPLSQYANLFDAVDSPTVGADGVSGAYNNRVAFLWVADNDHPDYGLPALYTRANGDGGFLYQCDSLASQHKMFWNKYYNVVLRWTPETRLFEFSIDGGDWYAFDMSVDYPTLRDPNEWFPQYVTMGGYGDIKGTTITHRAYWSHIACWHRSLSDAEARLLWQENALAAGQDESSRMSELASNLTLPDNLFGLDGGLTALNKASWNEGTGALALLRKWANDAGGTVFADASGVLRYHNRYHRYDNGEVCATFDASAGTGVEPDFEFEVDDADVRNAIELDVDYGIKATVSDRASIAKYGKRSHKLELDIQSSGEGRDAADLMLSRYREPPVRLNVVTVRPSACSDGALWEPVLCLEFGRKIRLNGLPESAPWQSLDAWIEGVEHSVTVEGGRVEWETVLNLSPVFNAYAWVLDESTLGESTILVY